MNEEQFLAILPYISADLVGMIIQKEKLSEEAALTKLYTSKLYASLEKENTKIWQYSTEMLYSLLAKEIQTGELVFPDV